VGRVPLSPPASVPLPETFTLENEMILRRGLLRGFWVGATIGAAGALATACSDSLPPPKAGSAPDAVESIEHEACDATPGGGHRVEKFDTRGDGKPVVIKVYNGAGRELCRISDINHDGKPDLYEYFDDSSRVRRREADYDSNGVIDAVEFYEEGKLVKREYDTTGQHRVDTWDFFDKASGKRTRRERDTTNDGKVDQWWTWEGDKITIAIDRNGDGQPDPGATLVLDAKTGESAKDAKTAPAPAGSGAPPPPATPASSGPADGPPPPASPLALPAASVAVPPLTTAPTSPVQPAAPKGVKK